MQVASFPSNICDEAGDLALNRASSSRTTTPSHITAVPGLVVIITSKSHDTAKQLFSSDNRRISQLTVLWTPTPDEQFKRSRDPEDIAHLKSLLQIPLGLPISERVP